MALSGPPAARPVPAAALDWAVRPGSAALLASARARLETGRSGPRSVLPVAAHERADVGRLLGVRWETSGKDVTVQVLGDALIRLGTSLEDLLVELGGPLRDAAAERARSTQARRDERATVRASLIDAGIPDQVAEMALRWVGPDGNAVEVAAAVGRAWAALPTKPCGANTSDTRPVGLAAFAGQVLDDPHALDRDRLAGRALVRAIAATNAIAASTVAGSEEHADAAASAAGEALLARNWRATYAQVGIVCDQVSSTVLVMNLPLSGLNPALEAITAVAGEPLWLTSSMTASGCAVAPHSSASNAPLVVRVCENPSVVEAAAAALGAACPALVCLYGRPSSAAWDVLKAVFAAGAKVLVSADRDEAGAQITGEILNAATGMGYPWLPHVPGLYEEQRLEALLEDLASASTP